MGSETTWDAGATTWDRDWDGPGTYTRWDFISDLLKIDQLARVLPSGWLTRALPARWLGTVRRGR